MAAAVNVTLDHPHMMATEENRSVGGGNDDAVVKRRCVEKLCGERGYESHAGMY